MKFATPRHLLAATIILGALAGVAGCSTPHAQPTTIAENTSAFTEAQKPRIIEHFDLTGGQLPENIVGAADGGVDVTFAAARQVAHISPSGKTTVLGALPTPENTAAKTPVLGFPLTTGLVRRGDTFYVLYATGEDATTGLWKLIPGHDPERIAALPGTGLPNGLAFDSRSDTFYAADSVTGNIVSIPLEGGEPTVWSADKALRTTGFLGVNGVKVHNGNVYASNLDLGTVVRIPIKSNRAAGAVTTVAKNLPGIDDFAFSGRGNQIIAAIDPTSTVVAISSTGKQHTLLTKGTACPTQPRSWSVARSYGSRVQRTRPSPTPT
ncbi:hypothetical protein P9139_04330 [Curtobacterium flaccumfaciens]|nr:hypothetical protein P9139_04330 [Curtobacterium flaccumfaciens]